MSKNWGLKSLLQLALVQGSVTFLISMTCHTFAEYGQKYTLQGMAGHTNFPSTIPFAVYDIAKIWTFMEL